MRETRGMGKNEESPWLVASAQARHPGCQWCGAEDRLRAIKESTDVAWLQRVVRWPDNQATVRAAAERRLRVLDKAARRAREAAGTGAITVTR